MLSHDDCSGMNKGLFFQASKRARHRLHYFGGGEATVVSRGGAGPVRLGQAGEQAVRAVAEIGPKTIIEAAGRRRILDGLTETVLTEVKNVANLSYTQQLRDFGAYAAENGLRFDFWVRANTQLSQPLLDAIDSGLINLRKIP